MSAFISCNNQGEKRINSKTTNKTQAANNSKKDYFAPPKVTFITSANLPKIIKAGKPTIVIDTAGMGAPFFTNYTVNDGLPINFITNCFQDKEGNLWVGTGGGGLVKYNGKNFITYTTAQGLSDNFIEYVMQDKAGNIWIGTISNGVSKYDGKKFTNYSVAQGLACNLVMGIAQDDDGNMWFATRSGASMFNGKTFTNYTTAQGLAGNRVECISKDKNGTLWFGCLSSINHFVLMNEPEAASDYLTKFSKLFRTVLNNSKKSLISLEDELEMLRLYLDMEKLRFKNGFDYYISVDDYLEPQGIFIPPLLFQPFAENAVWHGLMHKKEKGFLHVRLSVKGEILNFEIEDNGVGRRAAGTVKSKSAEKNKSLGLQITKDRLSLINGYANEETFFEIIDLVDESGTPSGTKVILKIKFRETNDG